MLEDHHKFDFLEFHLTQVVATDGSKLTIETTKALGKSQNEENVYIPKQLCSEMEKRGLHDPN